MSKKIFSSYSFRLFQLSLLSIFVITGCSEKSKNALPIATNFNIEVTEDKPKTATLLAEDKDGDKLVFSIKNFPNNGELDILNKSTGQFKYEPHANFSGEDQFTFRVSDGNAESSAVVTIVVNAVNDAPQAVENSYTLNEGDTKGANLLNDDSDPDVGDSISLNTTAVQLPSNGTLQLLANGNFIYTHNDSETTSDSFIYKITDTGGLTAQATVFLTINPVKDEPPIAVNESYTVNEGAEISANLLINASDPDAGDSISLNITPVQLPSNGLLVLQADGGFTYVHDGSETTSDSFKYEITDSIGLTAEATVTLTINSVNDLPVADDDQADTNKGIPVDINVLEGDSDPDGSIDASTITIVGTPVGGNAQAVNGKVRYTPNASFIGQGSFDYTVKDNNGSVSNVANVTVFVDYSNPIAIANCSFSAQQQTGLLKATDADLVDASTIIFKLGANGEIATNGWLTITSGSGRMRITDETTGAFEFELLNDDGLGEKLEFGFQVSVAGENSDSAIQSLVIEPRIMPLGDSITDGITDDNVGCTKLNSDDCSPAVSERNGYRKELYSSLADNYKIDFVGSQKSGNSGVGDDNDHEGHPGRTADWISGSVSGFLNNNPADIILLHIGTNDLNDDGQTPQDPDGVKAEVDGVLGDISLWAVAQNTEITVLLAKIIDYNPSNINVTDLNDEVAAMVGFASWANLTVKMVDQNSALADRSAGGDWQDKLHPSAQGYTKMASEWENALTPVLDDMCQ